AIALGAMIGDVDLGRGNGVDEIVAELGTGADIGAGTLRISASSTDDLKAESVAAGAGAVAAAGAQSNTPSDRSALAGSRAGAIVNATNVVLSSLRSQDVDSAADSFAFAAATGSGAGARNAINSKANVNIGSNAQVDAHNILINSKNTFVKDDHKDSDNL